MAAPRSRSDEAWPMCMGVAGDAPTHPQVVMMSAVFAQSPANCGACTYMPMYLAPSGVGVCHMFQGQASMGSVMPVAVYSPDGVAQWQGQHWAAQDSAFCYNPQAAVYAQEYGFARWAEQQWPGQDLPTCYNSEATCTCGSACHGSDAVGGCWQDAGSSVPLPTAFGGDAAETEGQSPEAFSSAGVAADQEHGEERSTGSDRRVRSGGGPRRPGPQQRQRARCNRADTAPIVPLRVAAEETPLGRGGQRREQPPAPFPPLKKAGPVEAAGAGVAGSVARLAFEAQGCRAVQAALCEARTQDAAALAGELRGFVRDAVGSPHANHVLQAIIELLPANLRAFVSEELLGAAAAASRHRYGCRVICRLLEHQPAAPAPQSPETALVEEVASETSRLFRHEFGRHVVASLLEHGSDEQRSQVAAALWVPNILGNALNRNASYVIEKALDICCHEDRKAMLDELLSNSDNLVALARSQAGSHVVRSMAMPAHRRRQSIITSLRVVSAEVQATKYGRSLLQDLGLAA